MSVCHIAGAVISINQRILQRCAVCGALLVDHDFNGSGKHLRMSIYSTNSLVREADVGRFQLVHDASTDPEGQVTQIEPDCCVYQLLPAGVAK